MTFESAYNKLSVSVLYRENVIFKCLFMFCNFDNQSFNHCSLFYYKLTIIIIHWDADLFFYCAQSFKTNLNRDECSVGWAERTLVTIWGWLSSERSLIRILTINGETESDFVDTKTRQGKNKRNCNSKFLIHNNLTTFP